MCALCNEAFDEGNSPERDLNDSVPDEDFYTESGQVGAYTPDSDPYDGDLMDSIMDSFFDEEGENPTISLTFHGKAPLIVEIYDNSVDFVGILKGQLVGVTLSEREVKSLINFLQNEFVYRNYKRGMAGNQMAENLQHEGDW